MTSKTLKMLALCALVAGLGLTSAGCASQAEGARSSYLPRVRAMELVPGDLAAPQNAQLRAALAAAVGVPVETSLDQVRNIEQLYLKMPPAGAAPLDPRATLAGTLIARSDKLCNEYLDEIATSQRTWRTTFSVLGLIAGTAGGISTPQRSAQILSATSGGLAGLSGKLDEGILSNQAGFLIRAANIDQRDELRRVLMESLSPGGTREKAPLPFVVSLVEAYHSRCSISDGLARLTDRVTTPKNAETPPTGIKEEPAPAEAPAAAAPPADSTKTGG